MELFEVEDDGGLISNTHSGVGGKGREGEGQASQDIKGSRGIGLGPTLLF